MEWKDNELTDEETEIVTNGINSGKIDETINLMGKEELLQFREKIVDKELTFDELKNVKAGMPKEVVSEQIDKNNDLFK